MSENKFQDCHTVAEALRRYRDMEVVDADDDFCLTVRLRQLQPPTVNDDQRKRAISAAIDYRSRPADVLVDHVIEAIGFGQKITPAPTPIPAPSFDGCETVRDVLRLVAHGASWTDYPSWTDYRDGIEAAEARIAELTPRTVDKAGRERARSAAIEWLSSRMVGGVGETRSLVDRIIDALDWTAAEPERHQCADMADDCCERTPAPATPTVELDCDGLLRLASGLNDIEVLTGIRLSVQVLRIGGDQ